MATGTVDRNGAGIARSGSGTSQGDGTALSVAIGYMPHHVTVWDMTSGKRYDYCSSMAPNNVFVTGSGADTTGLIVPMDKGFIVAASLNATGHTLVWNCE